MTLIKRGEIGQQNLYTLTFSGYFSIINFIFTIYSILGRIIRVTDEVIDYRRWIKDTFLLPLSEGDSLSSSTGSDASTLSAPASDTVNLLRKSTSQNKKLSNILVFLIK